MAVILKRNVNGETVMVPGIGPLVYKEEATVVYATKWD